MVAAAAVLLAAMGLGSAVAAPGAPQAGAEQEKPRDPAELIKGKWQATVAGRPFVFDLRLQEGDLVGTVLLPNKKTVKIEDGLFVVDEFSFTTVEDEVEWEWTGTISDTGMEGERERFDNDTTESFTAKRLP
jgi:hypothetical protein